ncbi:glycosyltransferase family 2 protein [Candidatus Desantisbacteria bacterium]|nr:glycosyltransferase family 2 protein [Candidatus Desantisbacteria bacterium]
MNLSVAIITFNEEENIRKCLESIKWADEIVVVDSFSTDKTVLICKEYTDKIVQKEWEGYGIQKQFALEQTTSDWVLSIDADERVSSELKQEILSTQLDKDAYNIPFKFYLLGRQLRFGGCGRERHIRLFRRQKAEFTQAMVHEDILVNGETGCLKNIIVHFSYKDIADYFDKFNQYSTIDAIKKFRQGKRIILTLQIFASILDFVKRYILQLGFLDGVPGFLWASFSSFHRMVKYAKLWEIQVEASRIKR